VSALVEILTLAGVTLASVPAVATSEPDPTSVRGHIEVPVPESFTATSRPRNVVETATAAPA
jgi:hypothetical protein